MEIIAGARLRASNLLFSTHRTGCALAQVEAGFLSIAVLENR
jgi:hypothetical protein